MRLTRILRASALPALVAGVCVLSLAGCGTGGGMPQQLEPTKPRMDREQEVGPTSVKQDGPSQTPATRDPESDNPRRSSPPRKY